MDEFQVDFYNYFIKQFTQIVKPEHALRWNINVDAISP